MSDIIVLGAGMNGLIAAHYLTKAGHRVKVLEKRSVPLTTWVGWKVLLDTSANQKLLCDLGIPFAGRKAAIGLLDRTGIARSIADYSATERAEAQRWYAIRTRRDPSIGYEERMPAERSFLLFDERQLGKQLGTAPVIYDTSIVELATGSVRTRDALFAYDYLVSTIPFWFLNRWMAWKKWPIISAVDMSVVTLGKDDMPMEKLAAMEPFDYVYLPFEQHLTRAINRGNSWQVEMAVDSFSPVEIIDELDAIFGTYREMSIRRIPGQLFPQELDPAPEIPPNWFLMGRHAAWNTKETIDISMERLWKWMKQNSI